MNAEPILSWQEEAEGYLVHNTAVRQAKIVNLASHGEEAKYVAVVSLHPAETDGAAILKAARKSLIKLKKASSTSNIIVPKQWVVLGDLPETATGAIDERQLRRSLTPMKETTTQTWRSEVETLVDEMKEAKNINNTSMERILVLLWAKVLKMNTANINLDDGFLAKGGDSITAIELSALSHKYGMGLAVPTILKHPKLSDMAGMVTWAEGGSRDPNNSTTDDTSQRSTQLKPMELVQDLFHDMGAILEEIRSLCSLDSVTDIEDLLPSTSLQDGLMVEEMKYPGTYTSHRVRELPAGTDYERFEAAWKKTIDLCTNLRTRLVRVDGHTLQVVLNGGTGWYSSEELAAWEPGHDEELPQMSSSFGQHLCRYGIVKRDDKVYFIWSLHHAIYDFWTLSIISDMLQHFYDSPDYQPTAPSYGAFVQSIKSIDSEKATQHWKKELSDAKAVVFPPPLPVTKTRKLATHKVHTHAMTPTCPSSVTKATVLRAAWGMILAKYSDSTDVCFGQVLSGRQASLPGVDKMPGLALATVPARLRLDASQPVQEMLLQMQESAMEAIEFEQFGLPNIAKISPEAKEACGFTSMFVIQPTAHDFFQNGPNRLIALDNAIQEGLYDYLSYSLLLRVEPRADSLTTYFTYDADMFCEEQIEGLTHQFANVVRQLSEPGALTVGDVSIVGEWDIEQINRWNNETPSVPLYKCVHELLSESLRASPEKVAIWTTSGTMTYKGLDTYTTKLAQYLVKKGVKEGMIIPFLFEKSMWAMVAFIATLKAGAAFLPLDASYPAARREVLIEETDAQFMIVSPKQRPGCEGLVPNVIELSPAFFIELGQEYSQVELPKVSPSSPVYAFFTSGSTGRPKGILLEHSAVAMSVLAHIQSYNINSETRTVQFCSYMFDIIIIDTFSVLIAGGTMCAPSEEERLYDCTGFMNLAGVNWAYLTPTFARTLNPDDLKTLKTLIMGAESIPKDVQDMWYGKLDLKFAYGPTEAAVSNTIYTVTSPDTPSSIIGKGFNTDCWVVEPDNHNRLVPVGCVGELVLHGYNLARGYLKNPVATEKAFPPDVDWMPRVEGDVRKYYKTGDLVKFRPDGNIEFFSRKDTQVKIRGRRIELGEVETAIKAALPRVVSVAVDVIRLETRVFLVAFIELPECRSDTREDFIMPVDAGIRKTMTGLISDLSASMPPYMVPSAFIPVSKIPMLQSLKTDRKTLRAVGQALTSAQFTEYSFTTTKRVKPTTDMEFKLRDLWAKVLKRDPDEIGKNDSFLGVGGDSMAAIELASQARKANMTLAVQDIFRTPKLCDMSLTLREAGEARQISPFSLLPQEHRDAIIQETSESLDLSADESIIDIYPSTTMQDRLMAAAEKSPGSYVALLSFKMLAADLDRFISAWNMTVDNCDNLRTRLVATSHGSWQVVLKTKQPCIGQVEEVENVSDALTALMLPPMVYSAPLGRFKLVKKDGSIFFLFAIHHSIFDGWSLNLLLTTLHDAYKMQTLPPRVPYTGFIEYLTTRDEAAAKDFWFKQLDGCKQTIFPRRSQASKNADSAAKLISRTTTLPASSDRSITIPSVVRAAWFIVLARYCNTTDACFSETVSGRLASVQGIEDMSGLTISMVPFRTRINKGQLAKSFLQDVQNQSSDMIAYEQYGLHNIAKLGPGFKEVIDCGHALVIQPLQTIQSQLQKLGGDSARILELPISEDETFLDAADRYDSFPLVINCQVLESSVHISYLYNGGYLSEKEALALSLQVDTVITQLVADSDKTLGEISIASSWDMDEMIQRNQQKSIELPATLSSLLPTDVTPEGMWVLDTHDADILTPSGCVGELVLELGAKAALQSELELIGSSLLSPLISPDSRLVRTGHLVRFQSDGSLEYVSEVGMDNANSQYAEVEDFIITSSAEISGAALGTVTIGSSPTLVALITEQVADQTSGASNVLPVTAEMDSIIQNIFHITQKRFLKNSVPEYIIPVDCIPNKGGALDAQRFQAMLNELAPDALSAFTFQKRAMVSPASKAEEDLRELWAVVLSMQPSDISSRDNFFLIGGDSFGAIQIVGEARRRGLNLTARAVFQTPVLADMAASLSSGQMEVVYTASPFSLLQSDDIGSFIASIMKLCNFSNPMSIEDVYPCTAMQEGLMSLGLTQPGAYINKISIPLKAGVDAAKFKAAWDEVIRVFENTRTRIVLVDGKAYQVVVREDAAWEDSSLDINSIGYGTRLCYYSLESQPDGTSVFNFMIHHSVYDGWVINLITQALEGFYHERPIPALQPFSGFVKYINSIDKQEASDYWTAKLQNASPATFPSKIAENTARLTKTTKKTVSFSKSVDIPVTQANVIRTAWALVLAQYTGTCDICFGSTVSGRQASVSGLEHMAGPMITTVPVRVEMDKAKSVMDLMVAVQKDASESTAFEQFGLQNIAQLGRDAKSACDFSSLLIIQASSMDNVSGDNNEGLFQYGTGEDILDEEVAQNFFNYPLVAQLFPSETSVGLHFTYNANVVSETELVAFSHQFEHILRQLHAAPDRTLSDLSFVSQWDENHALQSSRLVLPSDTCVHWRFEDQVAKNGNLPAIQAWDGDFTYTELYASAYRLAVMLQEHGIGPNALIPVCFVKSAWAIIAMMAVQLAGGAFVALDPEAPTQRLEALLTDIDAPFVLASKSCKEKLMSTSATIIIVNEDAIAALPGNSQLQKAATQPADTSFMIFTSGTTGKPKAVDISHSAICSSSDGYGRPLNIGPGTRVFQFSSYTFDVAILDILVSLMRGACICVPSDYSRLHELAASINSTQANWAFLTPTVANMLSPQEVPCLKTLCLGGEAVGEAVASKWKNAVDLHGLYGPAESSICSWRPLLGHHGKSTNIGQPLSSSFWAVEPTNSKKLVPVGCVGELLIQGPLLAKGYRNAATEDQEKWLQNIDWLPGNFSNRGYLTGDLVRRNADGTFDYMGRKDSQIKLRGQRIETGEIEYHLINAVQSAKQVAVDVVGPESSPALAAFVDFGSNKPSAQDAKALFSEALESLSLHLPSAMRPRYFIPVDQLPQTTNGKLDRRALRALIPAGSTSDLSQYSISRAMVSRQCETPVELEIRGLWSQVLGLPESSIGATDNFYNLGGDSIRIVTLVQRIKRTYGDIGLSVFGSSKTTIEVMAKLVQARADGQTTTEAPMHDFSGEVTSALETLSDIDSLQQRCSGSLPADATVLLTGATGYLGTELLHQLVQQSNIAKVAILVRAKSQEHAMRRIKTTAETAKWWKQKYETKIEVWLGDLGKEQLGLTATEYSRLLGLATSGNVDAIVHNGAVVNWSADFHALKAENVTATIQLLQATAASSKDPKFIFVSGGTGAKRDGTRSTTDMCKELADQNGYSQTKFISESIVCELAAKLPAGQSRIAVVKPSLIIGTEAAGVANVDDFIWRLAAASVALGRAPDMGEGQDWIQLAAVDVVAGTIIKPLLSKDGVQIFTEITNGMRSSEFWKLVGDAAGSDLVFTPYAKWHKAATRQMREVGEKHPLWAVQDFLQNDDSAAYTDDMMAANAPLPGTAEAIKSSVEYLQRIGFICKSAADFGKVTQAAISRSGIRSG